jgi:nitrous oxidase accessory protein NosD
MSDVDVKELERLLQQAFDTALNFANRADVAGNLVRGGTKKCLFIYNAASIAGCAGGGRSGC